MQEEQIDSKKRKMSDETEENDLTLIPRHMRAFTRCCVCGEIDRKHQMTLAPKMKKVLVKWSQVFGPEFLETCWKDKVNHYICSIHWKQLRDDWEGPLPEVLEKMKKENNGSFKITMYLNDIDEEGKDNFVKAESRICRYCGISNLERDMTKVPKNLKLLLKWAEILGKQFLENVRMYKDNMICWSHFEYRDEKSRSTHNFPIKDETMHKETQIDRTETCRYCNENRDKWKMVSVPEDSIKLGRWVEKLGPIFSENVMNHSTNYICWSHFNLPNMLKSSYLKYLPVADTELGVLNTTQSDIDNKVEQEPFRKSRGERIICRYCGMSCLTKNMTKIPQIDGQLLKWVEILGEEFRKNISSHTNNRICLSHFKHGNRIYRGVECLPMTEEMMNKEVTKGEVTNVKEVDDTGDDEKADLEMLKQEIKTEKGANAKHDDFDKNGAVSVPGYAYSTNISLENKKKPSIIVDNE